jgi:hypothetical protein
MNEELALWEIFIELWERFVVHALKLTKMLSGYQTWVSGADSSQVQREVRANLDDRGYLVILCGSNAQTKRDMLRAIDQENPLFNYQLCFSGFVRLCLSFESY